MRLRMPIGKRRLRKEKLQRAEKLLRVASVLETRQKPNGRGTEGEQDRSKRATRALKQKMRKEFSLEANRNGIMR